VYTHASDNKAWCCAVTQHVLHAASCRLNTDLLLLGLVVGTQASHNRVCCGFGVGWVTRALTLNCWFHFCVTTGLLQVSGAVVTCQIIDEHLCMTAQGMAGAAGSRMCRRSGFPAQGLAGVGAGTCTTTLRRRQPCTLHSCNPCVCYTESTVCIAARDSCALYMLPSLRHPLFS
jgi:hypothetical protein